MAFICLPCLTSQHMESRWQNLCAAKVLALRFPRFHLGAGKVLTAPIARNWNSFSHFRPFGRVPLVQCSPLHLGASKVFTFPPFHHWNHCSRVHHGWDKEHNILNIKHSCPYLARGFGRYSVHICWAGFHIISRSPFHVVHIISIWLP